MSERDVLAALAISGESIANFWNKVQKTDDCWIWAGARNKDGYGSARAGSRTVGAHRLAWLLAYGSSPGSLCVCHKCDNPSCVRPDHLFLGTIKDNNTDRSMKGRTRTRWTPERRQPADRNPNSKLSTAAIQDIRQRRIKGERLAALAQAFGVDQSTISKVCRGETWIEGNLAADVDRMPVKRSPLAKLTEAQAASIREDNRSSYEVAGDYGVNSSVIRRIRAGTAWKPKQESPHA